jgi:hypothetical protein
MMGAPYATKKALKASVGQRFRYIETSLFGSEFKPNGDNTVVGPDPYNKRNWYATVTCADGIIVKVK